MTILGRTFALGATMNDLQNKLDSVKGFFLTVLIKIEWYDDQAVLQRRTLLGNIINVYPDQRFRFCGQVFDRKGEMIGSTNEDNLYFKDIKLVALTSSLHTFFTLECVTSIEVKRGKDCWEKIWERS